MSRIVVTGASGFVGRALCFALREAGHSVTGIVRRRGTCIEGIDEFVDTSTDFAGLADAASLGSPGEKLDCVVHLAARVHVMRESITDPEAAFQATNVTGALHVAQAAWRTGARRFVFVSSVKALAERDSGRPLRESDLPDPQDAYGRSKLAAEQALMRYGSETGLDVVIVRPPLVYGPEVRGNFLRLLDAVAAGLPIPLGAADARRSLVYVDNLADALLRCATDPRAAHQCFHVADADDLTVQELTRAIGRHLRKPARLLPLPIAWLRIAGRLTARSSTIDRLISSLQLDTSRLHDVLDWYPPYSTEDGLEMTARWYRERRSKSP